MLGSNDDRFWKYSADFGPVLPKVALHIVLGGRIYCDQSPILQYFMLNFAVLARVPFFRFLKKPCEVLVPPSRVCHNVKCAFGMLRDDGIVDDAFVLVEKNRQR